MSYNFKFTPFAIICIICTFIVHFSLSNPIGQPVTAVKVKSNDRQQEAVRNENGALGNPARSEHKILANIISARKKKDVVNGNGNNKPVGPTNTVYNNGGNGNYKPPPPTNTQYSNGGNNQVGKPIPDYQAGIYGTNKKP